MENIVLDEEATIKLAGLKALATDHLRFLKDFERLAYKAFGVDPTEDTGSKISDFIWDEAVTADEVVDYLNWRRSGKDAA